MGQSILKVQGLTKKFSGMVAVDDLDLEVERGEITGLIGPNGAGKTTTFNLISGMLEPDAGTIEFNGHDLTDEPPYEIPRYGLARTFQSANIFAEMTVLENLMVVPCPGDVETEAHRLLEFVQLDDHKHLYGSELSGGQKILLGLARAMMLQPVMIMLDEPFAGVNPGLVDNIADLLDELVEEHGVTVFIISHEIEQISSSCDEVIVMSNGQHLVKDVPERVKRDERVVESYLGGSA
ncbi:ABC transporter ATP-binding protein [Halorubellus sp. JP-L1]|uniref:ABC transporter ATP-binding protein n=1 Tax=Halorubellus sp. JP-L1 TaxID=2715753 RepID=UPI00140CA8C2|nr:ABC transporter ATP-binding protein [Halorubellus sp. JP-L1]NHN42800.1 ABC transporter ATP-binding protein [Halorubellus sp. JP-L1]